MSISAPRGTIDILPESSYKWQHVEKTARYIASCFGYEEIRTPVFEHLELFTRGIGSGTDIVRKEMYLFEDKKGRKMALRPEGTATVMRSVLEHKLFARNFNKLFYIGAFFRYERPQSGRYRQFHQFGLEALGSEHPAVDAEIMHAACLFFKKLGIPDLTISLNSLGCSECRPRYKKALLSFLEDEQEGFCSDCKERMNINPMRVLDCKNPDCRSIAENAPVMLNFLCNKCALHFDSLQEHVKAFALPFKVNPKIVRGLDYYTGTVFEILTDALGAQDAVCGGGRYDLLAREIGNRDISAVGVAMGLERTLALMEKIGTVFPEKSKPYVYIVAMGSECETFTSSLLRELRNAGIRSERDYTGKSVKSQMKAAADSGSKYAFLIGSDELSGNYITVKKMSDSTQEQIPFDQISQFFLREDLSCD